MTGPLDFLTTSRLGERSPPSLCSPASLAALAARDSGVQVLPVITAAAPMTALRTMKDRRLISEGIAGSSGNAGGSASLLVLGVFMFAFLYMLVVSVRKVSICR